jgi:DNA-binding NarL/FixJ family response regulator
VDISLPDTNGFELVRSIRELDPDLPILVASGHPASDFEDRLAEVAVQGYVDKSVAYTTFIPAIWKILGTTKNSID